VSYVFEYSGPQERPKWARVITDADGVEQKVYLAFQNETERANLTVEEVYQHISNLIQYMKDVAQAAIPVAIDEDVPEDGWHIGGNWGEVEWAKNETYDWWKSVYFENEAS